MFMCHVQAHPLLPVSTHNSVSLNFFKRRSVASSMQQYWVLSGCTLEKRIADSVLLDVPPV